jgi:hypothetical protein
MFASRVLVDENVEDCQAFTEATICVLGTDFKLWLEHGPFGQVPPRRELIDSNVAALGGFQILFSITEVNGVCVLDNDGNLWVDVAPFGQSPRRQVDANVVRFQALIDTICVLGTDGNLWLEHPPFGQVPPRRELIDRHVSNRAVRPFQAVDDNTIFVLGSDGNLWLEQTPPGTPFGNPPPNRKPVDRHVDSFQALDKDTIFVVDADDHTLWLERAPFGQVPNPQRWKVDDDFKSFQALSADTVCVLGTDNYLRLKRAPFGASEGAVIDRHVALFRAIELDASNICVIDSWQKLWVERGPFSQ